MAGVVIHLAVADKTADMLNIKNIPLYFAGNIAPDCIHARENYEREMKRHTHFKDGIRDWDFLEPENLSIFHKRLESFAQKYCHEREDRELYIGYLSHLITDEMFIREIRSACVVKAEEYGISQTDREFFGFMMRELNWSDAFAAENYRFRNNPVETLRKSFGCEVKDYISADEIISSTEWICQNFFTGKKHYEPALLMNPERIYDFTESAADEISVKIKDFVKNIS